MARKRGGQIRHWAEDARIRAWYSEIKRCSGLSDHQLDFEFAWTSEGLRSRNSADRPRIFEGIGKVAREPQGLNSEWRGMKELVAAVDADPRFKGTQALYRADIWNLMQESLPTPDLVQTRIDRLLEEYNLARMPPETISKEAGGLIREYGLPAVYDRCLWLSLRQMDRFSGMALAWSLYVLAEPLHVAPIRAMIEKIVDELLQSFSSRYFPNDNWGLYGDAVWALQQTRLDMSSRLTDGYGFLETLNEWPIIPKSLAGKLGAEHLFAML